MCNKIEGLQSTSDVLAVEGGGVVGTEFVILTEKHSSPFLWLVWN